MTTALRALVAGSVTVDTIAVIGQDDIERITMHNDAASFLLVEQGRKVQAESITPHVGGGAANVAVSMQRQGLDAAVLGLTGADLDAGKIRTCLTAEGVNLAHLGETADAATGSAIHVSAHDHDAAIFVQRGANTLLTPAHLDGVRFADYHLVYAASLSNESAACFPHLLARAKDAGAFVASNPGVRQIVARPGELLDSLRHVDLLAINRDEAAALVPHILRQGVLRSRHVFDAGRNPPRLLLNGLRMAGFSAGLPDVMAALRELGAARVLVTDGSDGAYLACGERLHYCPSCPADVRGTAGAGDAFTSTVAAQLCAGQPPEQALLAASINAASVVADVDTQTGLLGQATLTAETARLAPAHAMKAWTL